MPTGLLTIAIITLLAVLSHRRSRLEEKILKNVPLSDWLVILVFPILMYLGWVIVVENILDRTRFPLLPISDFAILAMTILFMVYGFVGVALHFTAKVLWRYFAGFEHTTVYRVNEMFHGKLSHYLAYLNILFILFLLQVLEINHPLLSPLPSFYIVTTVVTGIVFGLSARRAIFYTNEWFGGYHKPLFFVTAILLTLSFTFFRIYRLKFSFYPVNLFVASMGVAFLFAFIFRQFFIFARVGQRRRLRFLAKILSA